MPTANATRKATDNLAYHVSVLCCHQLGRRELYEVNDPSLP
jgi:hypothetical protein